jgi:hypothetical protein
MTGQFHSCGDGGSAHLNAPTAPISLLDDGLHSGQLVCIFSEPLADFIGTLERLDEMRRVPSHSNDGEHRAYRS